MSTVTTKDDLVATSPALPMHETPAYRVRANVAACNTIELLAALIGGPHVTGGCGPMVDAASGASRAGTLRRALA